ncbi:calcium:proton antiporter [Methyloceanibacter methanicus]|uniref:Calcium:proton antiporter n=1 Tax=Methyloceanibacter methanicus TaxID=1774968 RepID=A0A1E3VX75_9HYPH|nr:calcium:proton antiporter [Methyloceanibacter methanicus]
MTALLFVAFGDDMMSNLENHPKSALLFVWLFAVMMWCAYAVMQQGEAVAEELGEPYGTLILTFSVIIIEVAMLAAIMLKGENNPTLARDAMFATLMIVLNGMVGTALLMGALRYWEQDYNLAGARAFLVVLTALSVFALILPNHTEIPPDPVKAPGKAILFAAITLLFYAVFVIIQTMRHRTFFAEPEQGPQDAQPQDAQPHGTRADEDPLRETGKKSHSLAFHTIMLLLCLLPVVILAEYLGEIVNYGIEDMELPDALGGVLIAILVLTPEGLSAFSAALSNRLQRSINICLGSALSTIGLTVPAVLAIGMLTGRDAELGLTEQETVLLVLTLFVSGMTFGGGRTNVINGVVHLLLFLVYVVLIFSP